MRLLPFLLLCCIISGCTDSDNIFYYDTNCDGAPFIVRRFIVDKERQTVLYQFASIYKSTVEEISAHYLDNCKVTDTKNFICGNFSMGKVFMSDGTLIEELKGSKIESQDCIYKKSFLGFKKITDAQIKNTQSLPSQNK
jgi:hypothetical protein